MTKYSLQFDGNIGDFIKFMRKTKKINSIELAQAAGKSNAYISHIENGRNNKPDYSTLYTIFKILGIDQEKIEDYLEFFGFLSPERLAHEEQLMIERMENGPSEAEIEQWVQREEEEREAFESNAVFNHNADTLLEDILNENIKNINFVFENITKHDLSNAYDLIEGLSESLEAMSTNIVLYNFTVKFFGEKLSSLDNEGLTKVLNTLYEELNRIDREKTAFGTPRQRKLIKHL